MKKISTSTGIIVIVIFAVILFGGVFAYQYFTPKFQQNSQFFGSSQKTDQTQIQTSNSQIIVSCTPEGEEYDITIRGKSFCCAGLIPQIVPGSAATNVCVNPSTQTANWKIYKNDEYGFEFKYPTDNFFDYYKDGIDSRCSAYNTNVPCKYIIGNPDEMKSINKMRVIFVPAELDKYVDTNSSKKIVVNNIQGYKVDYANSKTDPSFYQTVYYLKIDNDVLEVDFTYDTATKWKGNLNTELPFAEDLIINSFKFTSVK